LAVALRIADPTAVARLRLIVFDAYQQLWPRTFDPDLPVRVVVIDEKSLKKFGQWPWPRSVLATLTRRLAENGAAVVAFDFVLAEPDRMLASEILKWLDAGPATATVREQIKQLPSGDAAFAEAIATVPSVMGFIGVDDGTTMPAVHGGFAFAGDNPALFVPAFRGAVASLPLLQEKSVGSGALNWVPEYDQVVRRLPLLVRVGEQLYPSLAAEAIRVAQGATTFVVKSSGASGQDALGSKTGILSVQIGEFEIPTDSNGQIWLRFTKADPRRVIAASSVFDGAVKRSELEGRIVIVGVGAAGLSDIKTTPLDVSVAGAELHAQAVEQMLQGSHLRRFDFAQGAELIFLVLAGLALAAAVYRFGALKSGVIGATMLGCALASSMLAYNSFGLLFDPVYPIVALTCLYIATTVFRYFQTETERTRVLNTFGRYLTNDVVATLLRSPAGSQIGGEKGKVTMMMTDLRGFTALSERLEPEQVVGMLNTYFEAMIQVIEKYRGTIDEFIGDAIFVLFGAPLRKDDDAERAVACAVAMQLAMSSVNAKNRRHDLPELEMGIGIHTGQVVVGNIGSTKRMKYGVIGSHVNLTSRIQSFTTGGQILISQATRQEVDSIFVAGRRLELKAKGVAQLVAAFEVLGVQGAYDLHLPKATDALAALDAPVPFGYSVVEGATLVSETFKGTLTKLSPKEAEARIEAPLPLLSNLQMQLLAIDGGELPETFYGKITQIMRGDGLEVLIRFTSIPPSVEAFLRQQLTSV
jgi:adenylate cyclase